MSSVSGIVYEARELASELRTDTMVFRRKSGTAFDEATGGYTDTYTDVWSGPCRVKPRNVMTQDANAGERVISLHAFVVSVPIDVTALKVDDVGEVLTSETDPALPGTLMRVADVTKGSQISARRLSCEEVLT